MQTVGCHLLLWFVFSISCSFWQLQQNTSIFRMLVLFSLFSFFLFHKVAVMIVSNPGVLESTLCIVLFFFPDFFFFSWLSVFFLLRNRQWFLECQELTSLYSFGPCSFSNVALQLLWLVLPRSKAYRPFCVLGWAIQSWVARETPWSEVLAEGWRQTFDTSGSFYLLTGILLSVLEKREGQEIRNKSRKNYVWSIAFSFDSHKS